MTWKDFFHADPTQWLLESEPWVEYNTLKYLDDTEEDNTQKAEKARKSMVNHPKIRELIKRVQEWESYPLKRHNDAKHPLHALAMLADFGVTAQDPGVNQIVTTILSSQCKEGPFQIDMVIPTHFGGSGTSEKIWMACDTPTTVYALTKMGLDSPHVVDAATHCASLVGEKGVLCTGANPQFRGPGRKDDPCPYATLLATKALAQFPARNDAALKGAAMLLWHWEHQKERRLYLFGIGTKFKRLKYPFVWYDILHVAEVLSQIEEIRHSTKLREIVDTIVDRQDNQGRFTPESVWMAFKEWEFGQKKVPSPWITFLVARILKRLYG